MNDSTKTSIAAHNTRKLLLSLAERLSDEAHENDIVMHIGEGETDGQDLDAVIIVAKGEFRELLQARISVLRDVCATLKLLHKDRA